MKIKRYRLIVYIFIPIILLVLYNYYIKKSINKITIYYTSNLKGGIFSKNNLKTLDAKTNTFGGLSEVYSFLNKKRHSYLLLDTGNIFCGIPEIENNIHNAMRIVNIMNIIGYNAISLGVCDFNSGHNYLYKLANVATFPFLGANLKDENKNVVPYVITRLNNIKVGIIGLISNDLNRIDFRDNNLILEQPKDLLKKYVNEIKDRVDIIIVTVSNLDFLLPREKELIGTKLFNHIAEDISDIDVIIYGKNIRDTKSLHTFFLEEKQKTIICKPAESIGHLGKLELFIEKKNNNIFTFENSIIPLNCKADDNGDRYINELYSRIIDPKIDKSLTKLEAPLIKRPFEESNLANFLTDTILEASKNMFNNLDIALFRDIDILDNIKTKHISYRNLYRVIPIDSNIVIIKLLGKELKQILTNGLNLEKTYFMQFSGINVTYFYDIVTKKNKITTIKINKGELVLDKNYFVALPEYLLNTKPYKNFNKVTSLDLTVRNAILNKLKTINNLSYNTDKRLTRVNKY